MPEITVAHIAVLTVTVIVSLALGWILRANRSTSEKTAINAGWKEQLLSQRSEHQRLLEQNKSLMEQNAQFQASNKDSKMRAAELSDALKEAFERRDELQRQIKDIRSNLEVAMTERDQLQTDINDRNAEDDAATSAISRRDEKINKLNRELDRWQERIPPLIERFRARNAEAEQLEEELVASRERINALEAMVGSDQTRVDPVDPDALADGLDASNDPLDETPYTTYADNAAASADFEAVDEDDEIDPLDTAFEAFADDAFVEQPSGLVESHPQSSIAANSFDTNDHDNLKQIKGIGPAIEKTLNEMGIFRFDQIAAMSEYEIDRVARQLKGFRSRIYREDWIGQARNLHDQKLSG